MLFYLFYRRKWLPQPLRKLSQGKVDKPAVERTLIKKGSDKNLRVSYSEQLLVKLSYTFILLQLSENKNEQEYELNSSNTAQNTSQQDYEAEEEIAVELPPPMKPIQEPCVITNGPPVYKDLKDNTTTLVTIELKFSNLHHKK